jgi:hypothetical protein
MVAELSLESSEPLVLLVLDVELAMGVAALRASACPAVIWWLKSPAAVPMFPPCLTASTCAFGLCHH